MYGANFTVVNNETYNNNFILTEGYIDNKSYIKTWMTERGIEMNFDMTKTVGELKEELKQYYGLIEEV